MKTYVYLTVAAMMFLGACSSAYQTRSGYDDIYYSKKSAPAVVKTNEIPTAKTDNYSTNYEVVTDEAVETETNYSPKQGEYNETGGEEAAYTTDTETYYDDGGNTYVTNNYYGDYYDMDDYYDYAYAARIRRFHQNYTGFSYYHDYYTNYYWYNYNPWSWGVSIYFGYPWWYSSWYYRPYYYWGWSQYYGWGYPYYSYSWGYPSYYSSYWGYPSYYHHGYWNSYHHGYWDGYYHGTSDYYYNSYDRNSYYGPRNTISSTNGRNPNETSLGSGMTFGQKYQNAVLQDKASGRIDAPADIQNNRNNLDQVKNKDSEISKSPGRIEQIGNTDQSNIESGRVQTGAEAPVSKDNAERPGKFVNVPQDVQKNPTEGRTLQGESREVVPVQTPKTQPSRSGQSEAPVKTQERKPVEAPANYERPGYPKQPAQKQYEAPVRQQQYYTPPQRNNQQVSPNNSRQQEYNKPKSYSTPNYTKPKSSNQYTSPKSKVVPNYNTPQRQQNNRQYTPPSRNYNNGSYSTPRQQSSPAPRQRPAYKAPSRSSGSYSTPSRSSSSYSAPSKSSSSYSAPSRSSSSYSSPSSLGSRSSSSSPRSSGGRGR